MLSFSQAAGGLNVTAPTVVNNAPPGYYLLWILNGSGVPSQGRFIRISNFNSPPSAPTGLTAAGGVAKVTLNWNASAAATSYNVKRSTTSGGPYSTIASGVTSTSYTDPSVTGGTTYHYVVSAVNPSGESANSSQASATPVAPGTGTGLNGDYYDNMDFTVLRLTRTDATVNFDFGTGSPDPSIGVDTFSVRWTGQVQPPFSETVTFYTVSDDGVRLWVNNVLIIDNWTDHAPTENSGSITLTGGQRYDIRMDFYENGGGALATLSWSSPSLAKEIIPQSQLYPAAGGGTPPAAPSNLTATSPRKKVIDLAWSDNSGDETGFKIERATNAAGPFTQIATVAANVRTYRNSGLSSGTTYHYRVRATNGSGDSAYSNTASATAR